MSTVGELFVFLMTDDDGNEAVGGVQMGTTWVPLIATTPTELGPLRRRAQQAADQMGRTVRLVRFLGRSDLGTIRPSPQDS